MNEDEDRRRLKEKLKEALESARRNHELHEDSEGEVHADIIRHINSNFACRSVHNLPYSRFYRKKQILFSREGTYKCSGGQ